MMVHNFIEIKKLFGNYLLIVVIVLLSSVYGCSYAQRKYFIDSLNHSMLEQLSIYPQEKLHIHNDKAWYIAGEKIFFRAWLVDAFTNQPSALSEYVYAELLNTSDSVVAKVKIGKNDGYFSGYIPIPEDVFEGNYTICAYTQYMRNTGVDNVFRKQVFVGQPVEKYKFSVAKQRDAEDYDVTFFPEGGYLIQGENCIVSFKALTRDGSPENITGRLIDEKGVELNKFATLHDGMGGFAIEPLKGKKYFAECVSSSGKRKRFELPVSRADAYTLSAEKKDDELFLFILSGEDAKKSQKPLFLLVHNKGFIHYFQEINSDQFSLKFDMASFPSGIIQFLLLDDNLNPLSERLIFNRNDNDFAKVDFQTDKTNYSPREAVNAVFKIADNDNNLLPGSFSISVTDNADIPVDTTQTILTSLLLTSELKGNIPNPSYYFRENDERAAIALDLLLITHGWRRYNIPEALKGKYEQPSIMPERASTVQGRVKSLIRNRPIENAKIFLFSNPSGFVGDGLSDANGHFSIEIPEFEPDSMSFTAIALTEKGSDKLELLLDTVIFEKIFALKSQPIIAKNEIKPSFAQMNDYIAKADRQYLIENGMRVIDLPEVEVKTKRIDYTNNFSLFMPNEISNRLDVLTSAQIEAIHPATLSDLLNQFFSIRMQETDEGQLKAIIERGPRNLQDLGKEYAALIVDDMIIRDYDLNNIVDPENVEKIGILKPGSAKSVMLGSDGSYGAIVIETKKGASFTSNRSPSFNKQSIRPLGIQQPAEFYSPTYEKGAKPDAEHPDFRTTIYWNPNVELSETGETKLLFHAADTHSQYSVIIEGLLSNGKIIYNFNKIVVE